MGAKIRPGFTLIELMLVIIIGVIIFAVGLISFANFAPQANLSVEKQTAASVKAGISFYYFDPSRGNIQSFPAMLDAAEVGSDASETNPFFGQVLYEPVRKGWRKIGANTWEAQSSGNYYSYDQATGVFGAVEGPASTTTTTMIPATTTTTTTTTTSTTTTTTTTSYTAPTERNNAATNVTSTSGTANMSYDFGSAGSGDIQFYWIDGPGTLGWQQTGWVPASGSGTYSYNITGLNHNTQYVYQGYVRYNGTTLVGDPYGSKWFYTTP